MNKEQELIENIKTVISNAYYYSIPDIEDYSSALRQIEELIEEYYEDICKE